MFIQKGILLVVIICFGGIENGLQFSEYHILLGNVEPNCVAKTN